MIDQRNQTIQSLNTTMIESSRGNISIGNFLHGRTVISHDVLCYPQPHRGNERMNEALAKLIQSMTYEELTEFSRDIFDNIDNIVNDGQGMNHYAIAEGLIGSANAVMLGLVGNPISA